MFNFYISSCDSFFNSASYITKDELNKYIIDNGLKMNDNTNFKLYDERTWNLSSNNNE